MTYNKLKKTGTTKWDSIAGSIVQHSQWGAGRVIGATAIVAAALIVVSVLTIIEKKQEALLTRLPSQSPQAGKPQSLEPVAPKAATAEPTTNTQAPQNHDGEMRKYLIAAEQGDAVAQYKVGRMYYREKNYTEALRWARLSAEQGNPSGQNMLGNFYIGGSALHGVQLDHKEAVRLYRLAADQGEVGAIYSLGFAYYRGAGVPQDYKEAARLFRIAADQGYATAQYMLGSMYSDGYGVPKDKKEAIRFYGLAVDQGDKDAQFGLAQTYCEPGCIYGYTGRTKMKNGVVAYALFNHLCALKSTDDITCTMRDKVEIGLSRSEVDAGQALTRDLAQGKPTQVIARYLKTGAASK